MALNRVDLGIQYFPQFAADRAIANAQIYIGQPNLDPAVLANQIQAYVVQENGTQVPVPQPIRTSAGGVPTYNGSPVQIAVEQAAYSVKVLNSFGGQIYYQPNNTDFTLIDASQVAYLPAGTSAEETNVQDFLRMIVRVSNFEGFDPTGTNSSADAIESAFTYASQQSNLYQRTGTPLKTTATPKVTVIFPTASVYIDRKITCGVRQINLVGNNTLIWTKTNGVIPLDYLLEFTQGFDTVVSGFIFGSTETGCINFNCPNISGSRVTIEQCQFIGNTANTGIAIKYTNTSSILNVNRCLFLQIKHPFDHVSGDKVTFTGCWFDVTGTMTYADDEGYFNNVRGLFTLQDSLFAGGPSDKGVRTAYFNCTNSIELRVFRTRIGFEGGGGTLVNWKVAPAVGAGSSHRIGFTIEDVDLSPRDANVSFGTSRVATPVVRLYEMPNKMIFRKLAFRNQIQGIIAAAPSTSLTTLIGQISTLEPLDTNAKSSTRLVYSYEGDIGDETYLVATTDAVMYQRWLNLFNVFDWNFEPQATGNQSTYIWDTFFTGAYLRSGIWEVTARFRNAGSGGGQEYPRRWLLSTKTDPTALTRSFVLTNLDGVGAVDGKNITLTPKFVDFATLTETDTIADTATLTDYFIRLKATPTGTTTFSATYMYIVPAFGRDKSRTTFGTARQSIVA